MKTYAVYLHKNKTNGKVYVGVTGQNPKSRWKSGNGYKNKEFKEDIEKYGWDGFEHIILHEGLEEQEALNKERELIAFFGANDSEKGYNKTNGGDVLGMLGKHQTEDTKKRISESKKRIKFSDEHKKHISESKHGANHPKAKKVYQFTKDGFFVRSWDYMSQASEELGINKANLGEACNGNRKSAGGFVWSYTKGRV